MGSNSFEEGMLILDRLLGEDKGKYMEMLDSLHEGLGNAITEQVFGRLYSGDALDLKTKQLITVALLLDNGDKDQLVFHTQCALKLGATGEQLIELVLQSIAVIGVPKALRGLKIVKELLNK